MNYVGRDCGQILSLCFHSFDRNKQSAPKERLPFERATPYSFEKTIVTLLENGFHFPNPAIGDFSGIRNALITFDDGYANNRSILSILEKYQIHATLFVPTYFIQHSFWFFSDIVHFLRITGNSKHAEAAAILGVGSSRPIQERIAYIEFLERHFGFDFRNPAEGMRALTIDELHGLAQHPFIQLGAHTHTHVNAVYSEPTFFYEDLKLNIEYLQEITGNRINAFAFPYFMSNDSAVELIKPFKFKMVYTNNLRISNPDPDSLYVFRYCLVNDSAFDQQLNYLMTSRLKYRLYAILKRRLLPETAA